ncbi:MAG: hypothetical protein GY772_22575 [bacterium]|nr:hypothetical protein [bacterium]
MSPPPRPTLPPAEDTTVDVLQVMRGVIPYTHYALRQCLKDDRKYFASFPEQDLHLHCPLQIKTASNQHELLSYKSPWKLEEARISFEGTGRYEARCSVRARRP